MLDLERIITPETRYGARLANLTISLIEALLDGGSYETRSTGRMGLQASILLWRILSFRDGKAHKLDQMGEISLIISLAILVAVPLIGGDTHIITSRSSDLRELRGEYCLDGRIHGSREPGWQGAGRNGVAGSIGRAFSNQKL